MGWGNFILLMKYLETAFCINMDYIGDLKQWSDQKH